uniref:Integrase catalytic domain-containing protein n=1 Tax=Rhizophagus irregularis (strain DAOM 181602 / DAOM 197198 / MUCL 43194) TaxID=747089 RepID=U9SU46_RHIID
MRRHGVEIQKATSKRTVVIVERYNLTLARRLFRIQNAHDLSLHMLGKSHTWVKNLPIIVEDINNSVTRLIGITPAKAIKKKKVYAKHSCRYVRPIGYDESRLSYRDSVRYLLEPGELEGGPKSRGTDMKWSPEVYNIGEVRVQKNQPVLYAIGALQPTLLDQSPDAPFPLECSPVACPRPPP